MTCVCEVQSAIRPDSPLSGVAAVNVRLGSSGEEKVREGAEGVDKNDEGVRSSIPRGDKMTTSEDDFCANKAYTS